MADPGSLSGFIGVGIDMAINQILQHSTLRHRKELGALKDLVTTIQPIVKQIHQYRLELNRKRGTSAAKGDNNALGLNVWVKKLDELLRRALALVQKSTVPRYDVISSYQTSRRINTLISDMERHLESVPSVLLDQQLQRESTQASSSTTPTTSQTLAPMAGGFLIEEPFIVGQEKTFTTLEMWVIEADVKSLFRIGVVGKGGSGKTLLLKTLFNSQKVRDFFQDGLLLWLTVSQTPSFQSLRNQLCRQIALQTKEDPDLVKNMDDEGAKIWLNEKMQGNMFSVVLDDVWGEGGKLMEELGLALLRGQSKSKVIVSSRNRTALLELGVAENSTITMGDLVEDKSWELFSYHAFPHNNGNPPANIDERMAKLVCAKCGGLPLAIKAIGRAMAGITDEREWELALRRLGNNSEEHESLYDRLRWSYDSLDVNLQLCFLYLAAAFEKTKLLMSTW